MNDAHRSAARGLGRIPFLLTVRLASHAEAATLLGPLEALRIAVATAALQCAGVGAHGLQLLETRRATIAARSRITLPAASRTLVARGR